MGTVKALRFYRSESEKALPSALRGYLDRRILPASWYDEEESFELLRALGKVLAGRREKLEDWPEGLDVWEFLGYSGCQNYYEGAYRSLLRSGDPGGTLRNYDKLWKLRHDTGHVGVEIQSASSAAVELRDYVIVCRELCGTVSGTIRGVLEFAGATGIEIGKRSCRVDGHSACRWQATWENPADG